MYDKIAFRLRYAMQSVYLIKNHGKCVLYAVAFRFMVERVVWSFASRAATWRRSVDVRISQCCAIQRGEYRYRM